jgi:hypothetical protein
MNQNSSVGSFGQAISEEIFKNWPIRNKNGLWWSCLALDHLAKQIQRRFLKIDQPETRIA